MSIIPKQVEYNPRPWSLLRVGLLLCCLLALAACQFSLPNPLSRGDDNTSSGDGPTMQIEQVVTAGAVGEGNNPLDVRSTFSPNDPVIYVVALARDVTVGTTVQTRWSHAGVLFEDSPPIVAEGEYPETYIEFHIRPAEGGFEPGSYAVQFFINGEPGPTARFDVVSSNQ